jgi:hypothetical protein
MSDLVEFLKARLDEVEQAARAATPGPWRHDPDKHWRKPGTVWFEEAVFAGPSGDAATCVAGTGETEDRQSMADAEHIARHDPARVLAEVDTRRRIIAEHAEVDGACRVCTVEDREDAPYEQIDAGGPELVTVRRFMSYPCTTVRLLALPDADHADYREEWRP